MTIPQRHLAQTFVELADTLVDDFDLLAFLHMLTERCRDVLQVDAVGLLLADHNSVLNTVAASSEQARLMELFQMQTAEGPSHECFTTGEPVHAPDLTATPSRWPRFSDAALEQGFAASHALPLRLREQVIGALHLLGTRQSDVDPELLAIGQALADIATIGILHERAVHDRDVLTRQLQSALNSRILIEQAKGILAERLGVAVEEAFTTLRDFARRNNRRLHDVARAVVDNDPEALLIGRRSAG